jgi:hypothetical protein
MNALDDPAYFDKFASNQQKYVYEINYRLTHDQSFNLSTIVE